MYTIAWIRSHDPYYAPKRRRYHQPTPPRPPEQHMYIISIDNLAGWPYWAIVFFWEFFENYKSGPKFEATFSTK
jgi:hypothetical protein